MRLPPNHPQRYLLSNEIHARQPQELSAPERISYIAINYDSATTNLPHVAEAANAAINDLARKIETGAK